MNVSKRTFLGLASLLWLASGCGNASDEKTGNPAENLTGTGGAGPIASGGGGPVGTAGAAPVAAGGAAPIGTGPGAGGAVSPGGAASVSAGGASMGLPSGDAWTTASNLDANGKLIAPAADVGFQISTTGFDVKPGEELFKCFHMEMPNTQEFDVGEWESQMSAGSHHFIFYKTDGDTTPSGTLSDAGCVTGAGAAWLYASGKPHSHLPMPDGVAMPIAAKQRMSFDMHYINTGDSVIHAGVTLNLTKVKSAQFQKAQSQISFNTKINIPPNGTQTVGGDCTPPAGAKYFIMSTHTHRRGIDASITRVGGAGEVLVHTTNWDNPEPGLWEKPPYLTFAPGEKFHYSCSYQNDRPQATTVGSSAANNEMCMAVTYFFPAAPGGSCN